MEEKKFYDLKAKKVFVTNNYKFVTKAGRNFIVAKNPSGKESWLIVSKDFVKVNKK